MKTLELSWHVPSEEEVQWADSLVQQFVEPELDELERFMQDLTRLNKSVAGSSSQSVVLALRR